MKYAQTDITKSAQETAKLGQDLISTLLTGKGSRRPCIICLYGELGSGKTTFAQGFAKGLGITTRLLSPTFIIVRRYQLKTSSGFLYHIDLYRLSKKEEIEALGISEIFSDSESIVLVEWAEKLESLLPKERIDARFEVEENGAHTIKIEDHYGNRHNQ